jgi:mono/diheme cytochrome c family protein
MTRVLLVTLAIIGGCAVVAAIVLGTLAAAAVRGGFSTRTAPSALETMAARTARQFSMRGAAAGSKNPLEPSAEVLAEARHHWADHCAACHANDGSGQTEMGRNLYPKAPDMRLPATQSLTDGELFSIIVNGVRLTGMPAWGAEGGDQRETWALVHFIRHLPKVTNEELKEMERLNPKGPDEMQEEGDEAKFLEGADTAPSPQPHHH